MTGEANRETLEVGNAKNLPNTAAGVERPDDIEDFEGIYQQHRERVYNLCLRKAGNNEAKAQDFMNDAFLRLFRKLDAFHGVSTFYQTYAHRPKVADFIAEWICRQSEQYRQAPHHEEIKTKIPFIDTQGGRP